jgi:branched-chain amino acid transport system ATP-binding protein
MLRIDDLRVNYGRVPALHGISLQVDEGEAVAMIGPNGAGKTTTLSAIFGLVQVAGGSVVFEGESLVKALPETILRKGIALVPEGRHIFSTLTVAENLQLGTTARRDRSAAAAELESILGRFPVLSSYYNSSAGNLSGGEQQQLAIARSLMSEPRLLLLDEPTLGLAPLLVRLVIDLIRRLRDEQGLSVLLVDQSVQHALDLCDRAYIMRTGRVEAAGTPEELRRSREVQTAYMGVT